MRKAAIPDHATLLPLANALADASAQIILRHFRTSATTEFKQDDTPVTIADKQAEQAMRQLILDTYPEHMIIGEEGESDQYMDEGYCWVLDPIDGTKSFMTGRPTFTTLISVLYDGDPVIGIINQPVTGERWVGVEGVGTTLNGAPVHVRTSPPPPLAQCVVQSTSPEMFTGADRVAYRDLTSRVKGVVWGGDAYAYAQLASGNADMVVEADLKLWDFCALSPVVRGAGGVIGDWNGFGLGSDSDGRVVAAASKSLYSEATNILGGLAEVGFGEGRKKVSENVSYSNDLPKDPGEGSIESMTGFGCARVEARGLSVKASLKSVNSRFCEVSIKGPKLLSSYEQEFVTMIKQSAVRGKIIATLELEMLGTEGVTNLPVAVDVQAVKAVRKLLNEVCEVGHVKGPKLSDIMAFSEVLVPRDATRFAGGLQGSDLIPVAKQAIMKAVGDLKSSRRREGAILERDLMKRTRKIIEVLQEVEDRLPRRVEAARERLTRLVDGMEGINEGRLEIEIALLADRVDVTEETVRLRSHVKLFELSFLSGEAVGARLGFLLQEMHREASTLGSKSYDAPIAQLVVLIKEEIEKIREQCANIR